MLPVGHRPHPEVQSAAAGPGGMLLPVGVRRLQTYGAARDIRYAYSRVISADPSWVEADLELLDERGAVVLAVEGLQIGSGSSESANRQRLLNERLLTIEWQKRELPAAEPGRRRELAADQHVRRLRMWWPTALTDALKVERAQPTNMVWPQEADHSANAQQLAEHLRRGAFRRPGGAHRAEEREPRRRGRSAGRRLRAASGPRHQGAARTRR